MKKVIVLIIFLLFTNNTYADKKFEKDLKILSKYNSFINNKGESYSSDVKFNKDETIILIYAHEKDDFENTKTLSFLSNSKTVKFIDLSDTKCKGKVMLGGYHGITLTKCFANEDPRSREIAKYLEEIF